MHLTFDPCVTEDALGDQKREAFICTERSLHVGGCCCQFSCYIMSRLTSLGCQDSLAFPSWSQDEWAASDFVCILGRRGGRAASG